MAVFKMYNALSIIITVARFTNTDSKMDPRIIDGVPTTIDQFPHSALLYITGKKFWTCGSSILNQAVLLTVAHCLITFNNSTQKMEIFAGHEIYTQSKVRREVKTFFIHSAFRSKSVKHDIAILILKHPLPLGDKIKRVIVKVEFPDVDRAILASWGRIAGDKPTTLLQWTSQDLLPKDICAKYLKPTPGIFCAGDPSGVLGRAAKGDSGAALMVKFQQIGIVAFGKDEGFGITYYTNISYYYTWIKFLSEQKYCDSK